MQADDVVEIKVQQYSSFATTYNCVNQDFAMQLIKYIGRIVYNLQLWWPKKWFGKPRRELFEIRAEDARRHQFGGGLPYTGCPDKIGTKLSHSIHMYSIQIDTLKVP